MKRFAYLLILLIYFTACDDVNNEDVGPSFDLQLFTLPESPIVFSPKVFTVNEPSEISFSSTPTKGVLDIITDRKFVKYTPSSSFTNGTDSFRLNIVDQSGKEITKNIAIRVEEAIETNCDGYGGIFDYISLKPGENLDISLLQNDIFCNAGLYKGVSSVNFIGVDIPEGSGIEPNISISTDVRLTYTAPENFEGIVSFIYEVGGNCEDDITGPNPNQCELYMAALVNIEVSNEQ